MFDKIIQKREVGFLFSNFLDLLFIRFNFAQVELLSLEHSFIILTVIRCKVVYLLGSMFNFMKFVLEIWD